MYALYILFSKMILYMLLLLFPFVEWMIQMLPEDEHVLAAELIASGAALTL